ncbi:hypothetical protein BCF74_10358 [Knoellia remsis]|uniref:Uncharacterized protein n=1 Tax=Knoellia remsis TaxID=407159 RepID=A0A2T0UY55_9MICO|nr:hypothetical protein BCF74_10358 [Knoellia remsis]
MSLKSFPQSLTKFLTEGRDRINTMATPAIRSAP